MALNRLIEGGKYYHWSARMADGVEEAREKKFARGMRAGEETGDETASAVAFPFLARKLGRIDEGAVGLVAVEKPFFEEAIKRGHYGGVGERPAELLDDVTNGGFTRRPENFHPFEFEGAERQGLAQVGAGSGAIFEEADHSGSNVNMDCQGSKKPGYAGDFCYLSPFGIWIRRSRCSSINVPLIIQQNRPATNSPRAAG
jgi:hypothetical protein